MRPSIRGGPRGFLPNFRTSSAMPAEGSGNVPPGCHIQGATLSSAVGQWFRLSFRQLRVDCSNQSRIVRGYIRRKAGYDATLAVDQEFLEVP